MSGAAALAGGSPEGAGGLTAKGWERTGWSIVRPEGDVFGNGWLVVTNEEEAPLTLTGMDVDTDLDVLAIKVGPTASGIQQNLDRAAATALPDLAGSVIAPGESKQIVVVYRVPSASPATTRGVTVRYDGGSLALTNTLAVCSAAPCEQEYGDYKAPKP